uniref:Uncharacterized protein n=1 Tax=Moniliophthora roreri TaxID=221103 RepID=A0A0W0G0C8_MONRR
MVNKVSEAFKTGQ